MTTTNEQTLAASTSTATDEGAVISRAGLIGYIAYHTLSSNFVKLEDFEASLDAEGFEDLPVTPASWLRVFIDKCRSITHRYTVGDTGQRKVFSLELYRNTEHAAFGVHIGKVEDKRKHSLAQVAVIELDQKKEEVTWQLGDAGWLAGECTEDYVDRFIAEGGLAGMYNVTENDVREVARVLVDTSAKVMAEGGTVNNRQVHIVLSRVLQDRDHNCLNLRPTGGIYFVPNIPERSDLNPADIMRRLGRVIETVGRNALYLVPQFAEPGTIEAVSACVAETLSSKVAEVEKELTAIEEIEHAVSLAQQMAKVKDVMATADIYASLVQYKADGLRQRMDEVNEHLAKLVAAQVTKPKKVRKSRKPKTTPPLLTDTMQGVIERTVAAHKAKVAEEAKAAPVDGKWEHIDGTGDPVEVTIEGADEPTVEATFSWGRMAGVEVKRVCQLASRKMTRRGQDSDRATSAEGIESKGQLIVVKTVDGYRWTLADGAGREVNGAETSQASTVKAVLEAIAG